MRSQTWNQMDWVIAGFSNWLFTHSPKHGYCSVLKFCDVEEVPLFYGETLSILHGQEERVSSRNLRPEITEPGCRREREGDATLYTQKGPRHDRPHPQTVLSTTAWQVVLERQVSDQKASQQLLPRLFALCGSPSLATPTPLLRYYSLFIVYA
jgi:hypothetical protein